MARKRYTAEQIIEMLREAEVRLGQGAKVARSADLWAYRNRVITADDVSMAG